MVPSLSLRPDLPSCNKGGKQSFFKKKLFKYNLYIHRTQRMQDLTASTMLICKLFPGVNLDWINNQACRLSQDLYIITNLFITNNYLFEMIRKIIFTNYFS